MKAINYILGFGAVAAAGVAAIFCARVAHFGLACGDVRVAAAGWLGMIWFGALAVKLTAWSFAPGEAGVRAAERGEAR